MRTRYHRACAVAHLHLAVDAASRGDVAGAEDNQARARRHSRHLPRAERTLLEQPLIPNLAEMTARWAPVLSKRSLPHLLAVPLMLCLGVADGNRKANRVKRGETLAP